MSVVTGLQGVALAESKAAYDPSTCKDDAHGKLYIALGRSVLAINPRGAVVVGDISPNDKNLQRFPAPKPDEPTGCPGNPAQLQSYAWLYGSIGTTGSDAAKRYPQPDLLQLIRITDDNTRPSVRDIDWIAQSVRAEFSASICEMTPVSDHKFLPNGLTACLVPPDDKNRRVEDWAVSYISDPIYYSTPGGEKFIVNCGPQLFSSTISHCDTAYAMEPGFGVTYRFQPFLGVNHIPVEDIIDFDRSLREQIESAIIRNYYWADVASGNVNSVQ